MMTDAFDDAFRQAKTTRLPLPIWSEADAWDEAGIPKRPWVVKGYFLRGSVTLVAGPGSAGKSSLTVGWAVAAALGRDLGRFKPEGALTTFLFNVEDDAEEQRRRLSASLRQHGGTPADLAGRVIRCGPHDIGTLIERDPKTGEIFLTRAWDAIEAILDARRPAIAFFDPVVELHTSEENDNTALRAVIAKFRTLAGKFACAICLIHHTRKGAVAGEVDAIRGASAMVGAARVVLTVTTMTEDEAAALNIPKEQRRLFLRVDTPKSNYHQAHEADWHELVEHELDNGECVTAAHPWTPMGAEQDPAGRVALERDVEAGSPSGPYSTRLTPEEPRSIAPLLCRHGITTKGAQQKAIKRLWDAGFSVQEYRDRARRHIAKGIRSPSGLPAADWIGSWSPENEAR